MLVGSVSMRSRAEFMRRVESLFAPLDPIVARLEIPASRVCGITSLLLACASRVALVPKVPTYQKTEKFITSRFLQRHSLFLTHWKYLVTAASVILVLQGNHSLADSLTVEVIKLPALRINGQPATAHTQGLEMAGGRYYVTVRRDDVRPKRALLLRTETAGPAWDVWDITPVNPGGAVTALDHPGGMQSDGKRLWIPTAESKRNGRSVIRVFPLAGMVAGQPLKPEFEFAVNDHIGAVAVAADRGLVFGANWDTETVYVWDLEGHLKRTLTGAALGLRGLGVVAGSDSRSGVAVQDWKVIGDRLFASGLFRAPGSETVPPKSRLMSFTGFWNLISSEGLSRCLYTRAPSLRVRPWRSPTA